MDTVECAICSELYNSSSRRPKALPCGHTVCLEDLQGIYRRQGAIVCPFDSQVAAAPAEALPDNQVILMVLDSMELRCGSHDSLAELFCTGQFQPLCPACVHTCGCTCKSLPKDFSEVTYIVLDAVTRLNTYLAPFLAEDLALKVQKRYSNNLRDNVSLLRQLEDARNRKECLMCEECGRVADGSLSLSTFQSYCANHATQSFSEEGYFVQLQGKTGEAICSELRRMIPLVLKKVDFYRLTADQLAAAKTPPAIPMHLQQFCQSLLASVSYTKGSYVDCPEECFCPGCCSPLQKSESVLSVLPCHEAFHAICQQCVACSQGRVLCPIDGSQYNLTAKELQTMPELHIAQPESENEWGLPHLAAPIIGELPRQYDNFPQIMRGEAPILQPRQPKAIGSPLPPPVSVPDGVIVIDRFLSVLPPVDMDSSHMTPNQRGWKHVAGVGQVEAVVLTVAENVTLVGFELSAPVRASQCAVLRAVSLYRGTSATGAPLRVWPMQQRIPGGRRIACTVYLDPLVQLSKCQCYTLKIRLQGDPDTDFDMYRGNPYEKPEIWLGTDGTLWEFEACQFTDPGEYLNGQNDISGPILRLLYKIGNIA